METIGGVALSTYGLKLSHIEGHEDLPQYKQLVAEHDFCEKMRIKEERRVKVKLIGRYADRAAINTAIGNLKTKIRSAVKHRWIFTQHDFDWYCIVRDGLTVTITGNKVATVQITLTITRQ